MRSTRLNENRLLTLLGAFFCGLLSSQGTLKAAEIQVPESHESIQEAIDAAAPGDIISIGGGVYHENLDLKGKSIVLKSRSRSNPAILDGDGEPGSLLQCVSGEGATTRVDGLTFRRGLGDKFLYGEVALVGGGVLIRDSSPTLNDCRFELNVVTYNGGGIYARNSNSQINGCQFINNGAEKGAAIYATRSRLDITKCLFEQNNARFGGDAKLFFKRQPAFVAMMPGRAGTWFRMAVLMWLLPFASLSSFTQGSAGGDGRRMQAQDRNPGGHGGAERVGVFLRGASTNARTSKVLADLAAIKKPNSVFLPTRVEGGQMQGHAFVEKTCGKMRASMYGFVSHTKKRPDHLVLGRLFTGQVLAMPPVSNGK